MTESTKPPLLLKIEETFYLPTEVNFGDVTIRATANVSYDLLKTLRDHPDFDFKMLIDITAIDWMDQKAERFEIVYQLLSLTTLSRLTVRVFIPESAPKIQSVFSLWSGANFMERETFDMYGIIFDGHPDLRRLHLYEEFKGHPLRKDYPVQLKQPRIPLRAPEVSNTARLMVRPELIQIGEGKKIVRESGTNPIINQREANQ